MSTCGDQLIEQASQQGVAGVMRKRIAARAAVHEGRGSARDAGATAQYLIGIDLSSDGWVMRQGANALGLFRRQSRAGRFGDLAGLRPSRLVAEQGIADLFILPDPARGAGVARSLAGVGVQ